MEVSEASHQIIADLLAARTGQQMTESRRWRIGTALAGVFREHGLSNADQLVCLLAAPGQAALADEVVEALLNNETYFFRDRPTFDQITRHVLPELAQRRARRRRLQIWCAGCSTGQEAYSLAMQFVEDAAQWEGWSIDILGTDVSSRAIACARSGVYSQFEVQRGLTVTQMLTHFDESPEGWRLNAAARAPVRFQQHNVLGKPLATGGFDLILCRNVLLYFPAVTRQTAFARLREAIAHDGYLMLGAGETVVGQTGTFEPIQDRTSLYQPSELTEASADHLPCRVSAR